MSKSPDAFRTISEVADWLDTPAHVLRFWESKFSQVKPVKRAGGRRYYRPNDMLLLGGIKRLLHQDGLTIKEVQILLREKGAKHVGSLSTFDLSDDEDTITLQADDMIEVNATSDDTPVFTSVAPRTEIVQENDSQDDNDQMMFPGFEFASDRKKTFETPKPVESLKPTSIDISHIPDLDLNEGDGKAGPLTKLASLKAGDLRGRAAAALNVRKELESISDGRSNAANS